MEEWAGQVGRDVQAVEERCGRSLAAGVQTLEGALQDGLSDASTALQSLRSHADERLDRLAHALARHRTACEESTLRLEEAILESEVKEEVTTCVEYLVSCLEQVCVCVCVCANPEPEP